MKRNHFGTSTADAGRSREKISKLLDGIEVEALRSPELGPKISNLVREIRCEIPHEDVPHAVAAQFIEPFDLFENGMVPKDLQPDATGGFGHVTYRLYLGQRVAVKINKSNNKPEDFWREIETLHAISHDNIVGFRGWGHTENHEYEYLVMEHLDKTLLDYVTQHKNHETVGLLPKVIWEITNQLVQAMVYLHSHGIVHADLKPDNILIDSDPIIPKPKICDFGRAFRGNEDGEVKFKGHERYQTPTRDKIDPDELNDFLFDVFAFGLVVLFMKTGKIPYPGYGTQELRDRRDMNIPSQLCKDVQGYIIRDVRVPNSTIFHELIVSCCAERVADRPLFTEIQETYFGKDSKNPFDIKQYGDFFECGFLEDTYIHVADSIAGKDRDSFSRPVGYETTDLICGVETGQTNMRGKPEEEDLQKEYQTNYRSIQDDIRARNINEHVAVALKSLRLYRAEGSSKQRISLGFKDINYSHHRAMRLVWMSMELRRKKEKVPVLDQINPIFSTSFGVHVAILTNEGEGKTQKFVFAKRTKKQGRPSPGAYTCGAVRGCNAGDYLSPEEVSECDGLDSSKTYLSLIKAAARGLDEEIGLSLSPEEWSAITFQTTYMKFDTHEWGMGGFVDLSNEKILPKNRCDFLTLKTMFTSGPKDKYENTEIHGVDFNLSSMVEWIRKNHAQMASSAKIVAVKVMQAHFGAAEVAHAFKK